MSPEDKGTPQQPPNTETEALMIARELYKQGFASQQVAYGEQVDGVKFSLSAEFDPDGNIVRITRFRNGAPIKDSFTVSTGRHGTGVEFVNTPNSPEPGSQN